jgi:hypothetical protein
MEIIRASVVQLHHDMQHVCVFRNVLVDCFVGFLIPVAFFVLLYG